MEDLTFKQKGIVGEFCNGAFSIYFPVNYEEYERIPLKIWTYSYKIFLLSKYQSKLYKEGKLHYLDIYFLKLSSTSDDKTYCIHGDESYSEY